MTSDINIYDICGFWEVIRICEGDNIMLYPWLRKRYKIEFRDTQIFICVKDGQHFRGIWKLKKVVINNNQRFSIILNGLLEYVITEYSVNEINVSDHINNYLLVRKPGVVIDAN